jgi:uncharacterized protein (TIGR02996 family)
VEVPSALKAAFGGSVERAPDADIFPYSASTTTVGRTGATAGYSTAVTSDEERAFLAAARANLTDDLPRLVDADWLEENGQAERVEFVRVRIEIADRPNGGVCKHAVLWSNPRRCRTCALRRRELTLWRDILYRQAEWPAGMTFGFGDEGVVPGVLTGSWDRGMLTVRARWVVLW